MSTKAFISGCAGTVLSAREQQFFREQQPWGFIVFARNIENRAQMQRLTSQMRESVGRENAPILIDEEGGRVQRLRPPEWHSHPAGRMLGEIFHSDPKAGKRAAWLQARLIAHDLHEIGINVDCLPVLDVPGPGMHDAIGDRAYSSDPDVVAQIGAALCSGLLDGGVLPIVKHMPGQGRATTDSHHELPKVTATLDQLKATDFKPFRLLNTVAMGMSAHIVYPAIDGDNPATMSRVVVEDIIRGHMGFDGLLMSDDFSMRALSGDYSQRTKSAFGAGIEIVLHCNGLMEEMSEVAAATPVLSGKALARANRALEELKPPMPENVAGLRTEFEELVGLNV